MSLLRVKLELKGNPASQSRPNYHLPESNSKFRRIPNKSKQITA